MLKKIMRWVAYLAPVVFALPMFLITWQVERKETDYLKAQITDEWKLFGTPEGYLNESAIFNNTWLTIFGVLAIVSLVLAALVLVVYLLDDLKVTKLQKCEKLLGALLVLVTVVGIIVGLVAVFANTEIGVNLGGLVKIDTNNRLLPGAGFYVYAIGGLVMALLAVFTAGVGASKKSKKRK